MRIRITQPGIFNSNGEQIAVGTELDVKREPTRWAGRYEIIGRGGKGKTATTAATDGSPDGSQGDDNLQPTGKNPKDGGKGADATDGAEGKSTNPFYKKPENQ